MATATKAQVTIKDAVVPPIEIRRMNVVIVGDSTLVTHNWSQKAIGMIKGKQAGAPKQGKAPKVPEEEFEAAFYRTDDGKPAVPALAFKNAMVTAAKDADLKMTDMRRRFHVIGDMVELASDKPVMREDMVRVGMGSADIRYRPEFNNWSATLSIQYNTSVINEAVIINLLNLAGFGVGIGEHRPEKNGQWGRFHVADKQDIERLAKAAKKAA